MDYNFYIDSNIGGRKENQDNYGSILTKLGFLVIVCDGMGGANGGGIASQLAVNIIIEQFNNSNEESGIIALKQAIEYANLYIYNEAISNKVLMGMGTTICALLINEQKAVACHVGDSRLYQIRKGNILFRTNDHSKVFELVKRGLITEEQARLSEDSNVILRALGLKPEVEIELHENIFFKKGDRFFICTDGVCGIMPESQFLYNVSHNQKPQDAVKDLTYKITKLGINQGGTHDNFTMAITDVLFNSKIQLKLNMKHKHTLFVLFFLLTISIIFNILQWNGIFKNKTQIENVKINSDTLINSIEYDIKKGDSIKIDSNTYKNLFPDVIKEKDFEIN